MKKDESGLSFSDYVSLEVRNRYKEFWMFTYTNRYIVRDLECSDNPERFLTTMEDRIRELRYDFCPEVSRKAKGLVKEKLADLEFENCLVYSFVQEYENDNLYDLRYEVLRKQYNDPYSKFSVLEKELVTPSYNLAKKYGFTFTSILLAPSAEEIREIFIEKSSNITIEKYLKIIFSYKKNSESLKGVQILLANSKAAIKIDWDCVVYYKIGSVFSHFSIELDASWNTQGKAQVGERANYDIRLYINRKHCTRRYVKQVLLSQIFWLNFGQSGRMGLNGIKNSKVSFPVTGNPEVSIEGFYSKLFPTIAFATKSDEKKRNLEKDNVRRAIALMQWDQMNSGILTTKSEQRLFNETIDSLRSKDVKLLDFYQSEYSQPAGVNTIKGDSATVRDTVIREMKAEYDLCAACIDQHDYLSPTAIKKKK